MRYIHLRMYRLNTLYAVFKIVEKSKKMLNDKTSDIITIRVYQDNRVENVYFPPQDAIHFYINNPIVSESAFQTTFVNF